MFGKFSGCPFIHRSLLGNANAADNLRPIGSRNGESIGSGEGGVNGIPARRVDFLAGGFLLPSPLGGEGRGKKQDHAAAPRFGHGLPTSPGSGTVSRPCPRADRRSP